MLNMTKLEDYFEYACGSVAAIDTYVKLPELFEVERNAYTAYFRLYDVVICGMLVPDDKDYSLVPLHCSHFLSRNH